MMATSTRFLNQRFACNPHIPQPDWFSIGQEPSLDWAAECSQQLWVLLDNNQSLTGVEIVGHLDASIDFLRDEGCPSYTEVLHTDMKLRIRSLLRFALRNKWIIVLKDGNAV